MTQTPPTQPTGQNASPIAGILKDVAVATQAVRTKLGELTHSNRARIDSAIDKASDVVNRQTKGQYSGSVTKVATMIRKGVDQVENQRTATPPPATSSVPPTGTTASGVPQAQPGPTVLHPGTPSQAQAGPSAGPAPQASEPQAAPSQTQAGWRRDDSGNWVRGD